MKVRQNPNCWVGTQDREPDHLWLAYRGSVEGIPGDDEMRAALTDLDEVGLPPALERQDFDNWVVGALLESAWVGRIRSLWGRGIEWRFGLCSK